MVARWTVARGLRLVLRTALLVAASGVAGRTAHYVLHADRFRVRYLAVTGTHAIEPDTVRELAGLRPGQFVWEVDTDAIARRVASNPWFRRVAVHRALPHRVEIQVEERTAVALVADGDTWIVDGDGVAFKRYEPEDPVGDVPFITGLHVCGDARACATLREGVRAAAAIVERFRRSWASRFDRIAELHVDPILGWTLVLQHSHTLVQLGAYPLPGAMARLGAVLADLARKHERALAIHLDDARHLQAVRVDFAPADLAGSFADLSAAGGTKKPGAASPLGSFPRRTDGYDCGKNPAGSLRPGSSARPCDECPRNSSLAGDNVVEVRR